MWSQVTRTARLEQDLWQWAFRPKSVDKVYYVLHVQPQAVCQNPYRRT